MARPARFNAEYFTHTADFRNDRRIKAIRAQFGMAGYGLVLMLMEVLTDSDYTQLSTADIEMELLAGDLGVSVTEIHSLLQFAQKIGFFTQNEAGMLKCPDLDRALEPVFEKRNRARNNAQTPKDLVSVTETPETVTENTQSKVKESKVKNIDLIDNGGVAPEPPKGENLSEKHKAFLGLFNKTCKREFKTLPDKAKRQFDKLLKKGFKGDDFRKSLASGYSDSLTWIDASKYTPEYATRDAEFEKYLYANAPPGKSAEPKLSIKEKIAKQNARV